MSSLGARALIGSTAPLHTGCCKRTSAQSREASIGGRTERLIVPAVTFCAAAPDEAPAMRVIGEPLEPPMRKVKPVSRGALSPTVRYMQWPAVATVASPTQKAVHTECELCS